MSGPASPQRQLIAFGATLLTCVSIVAITNVVVDADGVRGRATVEAVAGTTDKLLVSSGEIDQRAWLRGAFEHRGCPSVLVLGSSTMGSVRLGPADRFLNGWLTSAQLEDVEGVAGLLAAHRCSLDLLVVGIDPWLFNPEERSERWLTLADERATFLGQGTAARAWSHVHDAAALAASESSWQTTRRSAALLASTARGATASEPPRLVDGGLEAACRGGHMLAVRFPDGTFERCPEDIGDHAAVDAQARRYLADNAHHMRTYARFDDGLAAHLGDVVARIPAGRRVIVAPPYHPLTWGLLYADPHVSARLVEVDRAIAEIAALSGARILDARDPAVLSLAGDDFIDSHHLGRSGAEKLARAIEASAPPVSP